MPRKFKVGDEVVVSLPADGVPTEISARDGQKGRVARWGDRKAPYHVTFNDGRTVLMWEQELVHASKKAKTRKKRGK